MHVDWTDARSLTIYWQV